MQIESLSQEQLDGFRRALIANATDLLVDAMLLFSKGRYPRAFSISILGVEELAKLMVATALRTNKAMMQGIPAKHINHILRTHQLKLASINALIPLLKFSPSTQNPNQQPIDKATFQELSNGGSRFRFTKAGRILRRARWRQIEVAY